MTVEMANVNCETTELTDPDLVKYTIKARRMVGRWAGIRGPGRKNNNPSESVYTREEGQESEEVEVLEDTVEEPAKSLPVHDRCEVLVVGGGPSGLSAALAARRAGADVILMERWVVAVHVYTVLRNVLNQNISAIRACLYFFDISSKKIILVS